MTPGQDDEDIEVSSPACMFGEFFGGDRMTRTYFDDKETQDPAKREAALMARLPEQVLHAKAQAPYYAAALKDIDASGVTSRAALAELPLTRKSELVELQAKNPPFGGLLAGQIPELSTIFQSPGPIYEAAGRGEAHGGFDRVLWAAGARPGDIVHNTFSYHLVPAGLLVHHGANALGCPVVPAGVGNTEAQLKVIEHLKPRVYVGTPSFLRIILEKGKELGTDTSSLKRGSVGAEALPPSLRAELERLGCIVRQSYGTAELGAVAYETDALEGLVISEDIIVEIVRPGTGEPVPEGDVGEVVVTVFNKHFPLLRLATGDLSAIMPGLSPCGRTAKRLRGWLGRADQRTKVKGMFVDPAQVNEVAKRHKEIGRFRLVVTSENNIDQMTLKVEASGGGDLVKAIEATLQSATKLRGSVELVAVGSLPNDGKVIEDARTYK
jgi:phenylacetate-CoA ligase